jgi:hypothetical protein
LQWIVIVGLLLRGHPWSVRKWLKPTVAALCISCVVTFGSFLIIRHALKLSPQEERAAKDAGATLDEQQQPQASIESRTVDIFTKVSVKTTFAQEMIKRARESGKWFAWLLWPELRFVGGIKVLSSVDTFLGWLVIAPLAIAVWIRVKKCEWLWLGIAHLRCGRQCADARGGHQSSAFGGLLSRVRRRTGSKPYQLHPRAG